MREKHYANGLFWLSPPGGAKKVCTRLRCRTILAMKCLVAEYPLLYILPEDKCYLCGQKGVTEDAVLTCTDGD